MDISSSPIAIKDSCFNLVILAILAATGLNCFSEGLLVFILLAILPQLDLIGDVLQSVQLLGHLAKAFPCFVKDTLALAIVLHFLVNQHGRVGRLLEAHRDDAGPVLAHEADLAVIVHEPFLARAILCLFDLVSLLLQILVVVQPAQVA